MVVWPGPWLPDDELSDRFSLADRYQTQHSGGARSSQTWTHLPGTYAGEFLQCNVLLARRVIRRGGTEPGFDKQGRDVSRVLDPSAMRPGGASADAIDSLTLSQAARRRHLSVVVGFKWNRC